MLSRAFVALSMIAALAVALPSLGIHVHLVAHTHDDTGWLKTVDQYHYGANNSIQFAGTRYIISSVIAGLLDNPERRFTYVEQAFFYRWWVEQDNATKANVRMLVNEGRLQFVNGGWCMHDEANPHYVDMIDQMTLGHRFLKRELNVTPKVGWQIDPFGHSNTNAYLLSAKAGFLSTFFGRADYQEYNYRKANKAREFMWQPSASHPEAKLLGGILLTNHYGPPSSFHWDVTNPVCEPIKDDPRLEDYNVEEKVNKFVQLAVAFANETLGSHIMLTMGDDFNYQAAEFWFQNLDKLIRYVNADGRVTANYSTPYLYTKAKLAEGLSFPPNTQDFFPYEDVPHGFWTGYFTSRPALKRFVRSTSAYYTAARQIQFGMSRRSAPVSLLADAMGLAQHHDAVAGTSKQHVAFDYAKRLDIGIHDDLNATLYDLGQLARLTLLQAGSNASLSYCLLLNSSICDATANLNGTSSGVHVLVWNSLARSRVNRTVFVPVPTNKVTVSEGFSFNVFETPIFWSNNYAKDNQTLPFVVAVNIPEIPPVGFATFTIAPTEVAPPSKGSASLASASGIVLENAFIRVEFNAVNGWVSQITNKVSAVQTNVSQEWCYYESNVGDSLSSQPSGAYIFRPKTGSMCQVLSASPPTVILNTPTLQIVERWVSDFIVERLSLGLHDRYLSHEFTVGHIPIDDGVGKEVVYRVNTSMETAGIMYTDSNGREMQRRVRNTRTYPFVQTEPIAGNYYPVNALAFVNDTSSQFSVLVDSSVGGASITDGSLEIMIHRRLLHDDYRGVGEPLNETEFITTYHDCGDMCGAHYGPGLIIRGEHLWSYEASSVAMDIVRPLMDEKFAIPQLFFVNGNDAFLGVASSSVVANVSLPLNVQLTTLQILDTGSILVRLSHQFALDESVTLSSAVEVNLQDFFLDAIEAVQETTVTTNQPIGSKTVQTSFLLNPMDVRTFEISFL